jgi:hypothetical protein
LSGANVDGRAACARLGERLTQGNHVGPASA